jgi:hypothetical protein
MYYVIHAKLININMLSPEKFDTFFTCRSINIHAWLNLIEYFNTGYVKLAHSIVYFPNMANHIQGSNSEPQF